MAKGRYEVGASMAQIASSARDRISGSEDVATKQSMSIFALLLQYQGKYEAAEEMNRRALEGREKVLGKDYPDTLTGVYCLAYLLHQRK